MATKNFKNENITFIKFLLNSAVVNNTISPCISFKKGWKGKECNVGQEVDALSKGTSIITFGHQTKNKYKSN